MSDAVDTSSSVTDARLQSIEARLSALEARMNTVSPASASTLELKDSVAGVPTSKLQAPAPVKKEDTPGHWLGLVAIICFVLASGFIIKLSVESGWLTPTRQLGLAGLLGISLIGAGFALMRSDKEYASLLPGGGIIILYLTVFAAHRYYGVIPFETAIGAAGLISVICMWLYTRIHHDMYAITAAAGAYLSPLMLGCNAGGEFSLYYFLLCTCVFATLSVQVVSRTLMLVSAYAAIAVTTLVGLDTKLDANVAVFLALHFILFAGATYIYTLRNRSPLSERDAWIYLPLLLMFYACEYMFVHRISPGLAPWISLLFAGFLIALYISAKARSHHELKSEPAVLGFMTLVIYHSVYLELLPESARPWAFILIVSIAAFLPTWGALLKKIPVSLYIPAMATGAILCIEYINLLIHVIPNGETFLQFIMALVSFGAMWALIIRTDKKGDTPQQLYRVLLNAAHILAVSGLYRLTGDAGALAVSASWLFYAVCVMALAFARKDEIMATSALFILAFSAGKVLLFDAAAAPKVVRIGCLLLTGAVLYGCGLFMRKIADWNTPTEHADEHV